MSASEAFFDTNVVLYLLSADKAKADRAEDLLASGGRVSVQVLNEFATVCTRKLAMRWRDVREALAQIQAICPVEPLTVDTHERALKLAERYGLPVYDACIVSAALLSGCRVLYSEDLQDGQVFERKLTVSNPFRSAV